MRTTLPAVIFVVLAVSSAAAEWNVWTVTETRRVLRDDPPAAAKAVSIAAARNEWESFQILVRSAEPVAGVRVEPADLVGNNGAVLPAASARLYRQHQFLLDQSTYRNDAFKPGWYPDGLIPFLHPVTGKPLSGRLRAVPFDLPAGQTHGFWVDLYVPPGTPAGVYRGAYRVTAADGRKAEVPVELTVWNFELPATPTLQTALGSPAARLRGYYRKQADKAKPPADWAEVDAQCYALAAEHRINADPTFDLSPKPRSDGSFEVPGETVAALRGFIDRYHVNAVPIAHPSRAIKDPEQDREKLRAWLAAWDAAIRALDRPGVVLYVYLKDEPNDPDEYRYVQQWGRAIRQFKPAIKLLVVEQTKTQDPKWGDLYGAVDIWCPLFSLHDAETAAARRALGETVWTYTALCQGNKTPWWHTDFPLLHYRVPGPLAWRHDMQGLLYWGGMSFWDQVDDPWSDPKTLDRRNQGKGLLYNGEGSLVYPARAVGYEGIAPSLRLKALRDGIEDFEYLAMLQRAGHGDQARRIIAPLAVSWFQWAEDPAAWAAARKQLAAAIVP